MAASRLSSILAHVKPNQRPVDRITQQNPDDIVITLAIRTPICRSRGGSFKDTPLDGLVFKILQQVVERSNIDPGLVEEICLGNPYSKLTEQVTDGRAAYHARAATLAAGFPNTTAASSTARFCSSGLKATADMANQIACGAIEVAVAVGAENLGSRPPRLDRPFYDEILEASQEAIDCQQPMGQTSENVSQEFDISRQLQDEYAVESYRRAEVAQKAGWFDDEIVPITIKKDGKPVTLVRDEALRHGTTYEKICKLPPAFPDHGSTTHAGNSSQVTDGAAAVLLMKRSKAIELKQPILGKYVGSTVAGLAPRIMGIGPAIAIPKLLNKYDLTLDDIDIIEMNEAFASMAVYCRDKLKLDWTKLNPRGGAIALGHPFGCTGVRQIVTGLSECRRRKAKVLLTTMCMGTGMGMAALFVNEQI